MRVGSGDPRAIEKLYLQYSYSSFQKIENSFFTCFRIKAIVVFPACFNFPVKLICCIALVSASGAYCLFKSLQLSYKFL